MPTTREAKCGVCDEQRIYDVLETVTLSNDRVAYFGRCPVCKHEAVLIHPRMGFSEDEYLLGRTTYHVGDDDQMQALASALDVDVKTLPNLFPGLSAP